MASEGTLDSFDQEGDQVRLLDVREETSTQEMPLLQEQTNVLLVALRLAVQAGLEADEVLVTIETAAQQLLELVPLDGQVPVGGPPFPNLLLHGLLSDTHTLVVPDLVASEIMSRSGSASAFSAI